MKNHHEVGHFKNRMMIVLLSLIALLVMAGQSYATDCSSCHRMPPLDSANGTRIPSTGAFKGSHQKHMGATAGDAECTKCHGNTNYNNNHAATNSYMIQMKSNINNSQGVGTYSKTAPFPQSATPSMGSCSNVNCHFEKSAGSAPVWGNTTPAVDCNFCHATPPVTANHASGNANHAKHLASVAYGTTMTCTSCHPNYGTTNFSHATSAQKRKISVNTILNYAGGTTISWLPSQAPAYGLCSNVYCHSNGKGVYNNATWGNTSTGCNFCHPTLSGSHTKHTGSLLTEINFYNYTATTSNGASYKFGCANCHPFTVASHINNSVEVDLVKSASGGHLRNLNIAGATINASNKCLNVYCHSNGYVSATFRCATSLAWTDKFDNYTATSKGKKDKCAWCHGNSPNTDAIKMPGSAAHTAHTVGIHYDDIFNGKSRKLPQAGGQTVNAAHGRDNRSTTINCNICHYATVSVNYNDRSSTCVGCHNGTTAPLKNPVGTVAPATINTNHVNGKVEVVFASQKIATKAQVVGSAFVGYTAGTGGWSRNSNAMQFKTYTSSYDVTKNTLSAAATAYTTTANGCQNIACHSNITVKWTDTVTCTSCHIRLK